MSSTAKSYRKRRTLGVADLGLFEEVFSNLFNNPFFIKDAEGCYVAANSAMAKLCGASQAEDLIGRRAANFFPPQYSRRYEILDRQVLATGRSLSNVLDLTLSGRQKPVWLIFSRFPLPDAKGRTVGVIGAARAFGSKDRRNPIFNRLETAVDHIRENARYSLDLEFLAKKSGVSGSQLQRDFKQILGLTPQSFQQSIRIDLAISKLESDANISMIAVACGYSDHSAFSRGFKKVTGMTPTDYRNTFQGSD